MQTLIGTSGYSYPAWKGKFYPAGLSAKKMLPYYASKFPTVELNSSFYGMPTAQQVQGWSDDVPASFRFAVKAPQRITHHLRLKGAGATLQELWTTITPLAKKLGPLLFQLPPNFKQDLGLLRAFLDELPSQCRAAFEFRHDSWFADEVYQALGDAGAALCVAEDVKLATPLEATTDWGYLRLRREDYADADIRKWGRRIAAQKWKRAFVYFKHEDEATGPRFAALLTSLLAK